MITSNLVNLVNDIDVYTFYYILFGVKIISKNLHENHTLYMHYNTVIDHVIFTLQANTKWTAISKMNDKKIA